MRSLERVNRTHSMEEVMDLMEPLISTWFRERFDMLTEPQAKAIPAIHQRKNVLVSSPTGSGKTLTAFTSIINELTRYAAEGKLEERIYCVYISPLKALANDVNRNLNTPLAEMREVAAARGMNVPGIKVAVRSGDTPQNERQKMVRHPPHILITTPESLALMLAAPKFKENLRKVEWVILDEIHDICDSKRGAFLSLTLERLRDHCETDFSRIGLSATLAPIEAIAGFLAGCGADAAHREVTLVEADSKKELDLKVICPTDDMTALSSDIVNSMMYDKVKEMVDRHETTLIFTNTRSGAESVVYKLKERGLESVEVHHSSLGRETRLDVEERLKRGEIKCVVSSTSLELGIDIGSIDLVCQIGSPKSVAKGLQRIGRSGHSFGRVAKGRLIVFDPDDLVECAVMCRAAHRGDIDRVSIPENCLDVLAQAVVGMSLDKRWDADAAYDLVKGSYCYRNLSKGSFTDVLRYLGSKDEHEGVYSKIWYDEEDNTFGRKKGARMIYLMNLGTIPEEANYRVVTNHGSVAGELSEKFVERLAPRDVFVLGGRSLEFVRSKGMVAHVKEATGRKPTVPSWAGEMLPRSFDLSMDVAVFRKEMSQLISDEPADLILKLSYDLDIDEGSARSLISYFKEQKAVTGSIPDIDRLAIEEYIDPSGNQRIIFHFPFGRRVNDALSRGYAYRLSNMIGSNVSVTMSDDNFMIGTPRKIDIGQIPGLLSSRELDPILRKAIKDSEIFKLRFRHTAARSFMILRNYLGRPISVNRQQVRSSYLLDMLGNMENVPVIEETYREVLEDDMDIKSAAEVLEMIENGKMGVDVFPFSGTPSPFAHSIILSGFSDIVLMEDRSELLKELHRKVLHRALGDSVKEFEFSEDQVIPYFRQKIGRIASKNDIVPLLMRTGPLQAIRERGRNIYSYCDDDKKVVDEWVRELLKEGAIGTVFLDEPHIMVRSEVPIYAAATAKERELNDIDVKVLERVGNGTALSEITAALEISEDVTFRSMRKLESMYLVTRTDITANNKWYFSKADYPPLDKDKCLDEIVFRYLGCFAPSTVPEVAFALSITEKEAQSALDSLVNSEEAVRGQFLVSQSPQYMKMIDRMRLRAGKENIYDFDTVDEYRRTKGEQFGTIEDYFKFYGSAGSEIDVYNRVKNFSLEEWYGLRESERLLLGRFIRGRVRYVLSEDGDRLAALRPSEITSSDKELLSLIEGMGQATMRQLVAATGGEKNDIKESIQRLDRSLMIIRAFTDREDWGTENTYKPYYPERPATDQTEELVREYILSYGPIPAQALRFLLGLAADEAERLAVSAGAVTIFVGNGQSQMYIMPEEVPLISKVRNRKETLTIRSLFDPDLGSKWAELSARYGDRWIYPATKGNKVVGALEIWEMSGCIEVRSMDMDSPDLLPEVLAALDRLMGFFNMKGVDIVRVREILGKDASELDDDKVKCLKDNGYRFVNGFYAKGDFIDRTMSDEEHLSYVFLRQRISKSAKFSTVGEAVKARGYIRNDQEMVTRVSQKVPFKKILGGGGLLRMSLLPGYVGYTTAEFAPFYRSAKAADQDRDAGTIAALIRDRQPISRKEIVSNSPFSEERTLELISELSKASALCQDQDSFYYVVPPSGLGREEALRAITRRHFKDFGTFSAEELAQFLSVRMSMVRRTLSDLEEEGFLVKGFLVNDDPTPRWMLKEDAETKPEPFTETFLLNTQDNLHIYLRDMIKRECGATECVVFDGTKIIGSFSGKISSSGAKVENFKGSEKAYRHMKETAKSLGVKIEEKKAQEEEDWDVSEFYLKTNPGAI
ncbi:MAG: ATP-dependent helicase [Methanomassiliicoccaceae archaeon]|nr:ATP-dependent helicase [Methanomassiliicoccaceae archaeon]MCL2145721.1 ATP-dependent helicase [Methanomassiliicoccaceae archaeon]